MSDDCLKCCLDGVQPRLMSSYKCFKGRKSAPVMMAAAAAGMGGKNVIDATGTSPLCPCLCHEINNGNIHGHDRRKKRKRLSIHNHTNLDQIIIVCPRFWHVPARLHRDLVILMGQKNALDICIAHRCDIIHNTFVNSRLDGWVETSLGLDASLNESLTA